MKITKIEFIKHVKPNGSCGAGYSEPDIFHITCDNGYEKDVWIDIWYMTEDYAEKEFVKTIKDELIKVDNIHEAFDMYKEALKKTMHCPYYWKEL